ncbi:MAG: PAS domain-containing protein [Candidatus Thiodiazotropha sp.]
MRVRRFTTHATNLFSLVPSVIGRPLSDLTSHLDYHLLQKDSQEVLRIPMFYQKQMTTNDSKCYRVRIMPYRTNNNVIEGLMISFTDITHIQDLELTLKNS